MNRRNFITGLVSALAAPVIVRSTSLMQVRGIVMPPPVTYSWTGGIHMIVPDETLPFLRLITDSGIPGWTHIYDWPNDVLTRVT